MPSQRFGVKATDQGMDRIVRKQGVAWGCTVLGDLAWPGSGVMNDSLRRSVDQCHSSRVTGSGITQSMLSLAVQLAVLLT